MSSISAVASPSVVAAAPAPGFLFNSSAREFAPSPIMQPMASPMVNSINFDCYSSDDDGRPPRKVKPSTAKKKDSPGDDILTSEAFPTLGGGKAPSEKKASAWSKPLSTKLKKSEEQKVEEENKGQKCAKVQEEEKAWGKNPQEDSDQEVPTVALDSKPEEQEPEENTNAPWRKGFKPSGDNSEVEAKPWRKAAAEPVEPEEEAPAVKIRPWSKAKTSTAEIDAGKEDSISIPPWKKTASSPDESPVAEAAGDEEAKEEVSRRPWKKNVPWRTAKDDEEKPFESETKKEEKPNDDEKEEEEAQKRESKAAAQAKLEADAKVKAEKRARLQAKREEVAQLKAKAEEEARLKEKEEKEEEEEEVQKRECDAAAQAKLEADAKVKAEEQVRLQEKQEELARLKAKATQKAEEKAARLKEEAKQKAEEEARLKDKAVEEARLKAKAEEEARLEEKVEEAARVKEEKLQEEKKAEKAKKDEEKEARRKAYAEKFKALKEAEDQVEKAKEALAASMASTIAPTEQREDEDSSVVTEESASEVDEPVRRSIPVSPNRGSLTQSLTGRPVLAPGGGMLSGSLTSLCLAPMRPQTAPKANTFSMSSMLQWRHAAEAEGLADSTVVYRTEVLPEAELALLYAAETTQMSTVEAKPKKERKSREARAEKEPRMEKGDEWRPLRREITAPAVLESSETSWAARQKQLREEKKRKEEGATMKSDVEVVREMKSILNKLTLEKYDTLYEKMLSCGISTVEHVRILIHEVMEKATTQHHFINMYAQFCAHLNEWFVENKVSSDPKTGFKRILLNECQNSFERYLKPIDLKGLEGDELQMAQIRYKLTMLGNLKFVGALLQKKMLASSVLIGVAEELCAEPCTPEALESLATFLTSVGGTFDRDDWQHHKRFSVVFDKIQKKITDKDVPGRIRFLLQDLVDLRNTGWEDLKLATKKQEGPSKLGDVAKKREAEETGKSMDGFQTVSR